MRAVQVSELTGPAALQIVEVDEPVADGENLLVDVKAAGVSFPELLQTRGQYQVKLDPPFILGGELAGVVREAPAGSGFATGDRVTALAPFGGAFAEVALVPSMAAFKLPDTLDFGQGAGYCMNYHTAHFALARRAACEREVGGVVVHAVAGALAEVERVGQLEGGHRRHESDLGERPAERRQRRHAVAGGEARARWRLAYDARQLAAEDERRVELHLVLAARLQQLGERDPGRLDVDEQVLAVGDGLVDLDDLQRRGPGQLADLDGPHTGITPIFFHGRSTFFVAAISSALITTGRVSRGSMMSSIIALPAAM